MDKIENNANENSNWFACVKHIIIHIKLLIRKRFCLKKKKKC